MLFKYLLNLNNSRFGVLQQHLDKVKSLKELKLEAERLGVTNKSNSKQGTTELIRFPNIKIINIINIKYFNLFLQKIEIE
jgi:hypothetical protein